MFCWKADVILSEIERLMPDLHAGLKKLEAEPHKLSEIYPGLPKDTIDYGEVCDPLRSG